MYKKARSLQSCCFANPNLLLFFLLVAVAVAVAYASHRLIYDAYKCLSSNHKALETRKYYYYLSHAQSSLMHVAEVKHGLCVVLLFRCQSVVICSCLVINLGSVTIIMIITHFHSSCCVTYGKTNRKLMQKNTSIYATIVLV